MKKKFAYILFAEHPNDIIIKPKIIKKLPQSIIQAYIKKNNPYIMEEIIICQEEGYKITLPVLATDHKDFVEEILEKTLDQLAEDGVELVVKPKESEIDFPDIINIASGKYHIPFLINKVMSKTIKTTHKNIKDIEVAIIHDDDCLTDCFIDNISTEVNHLTILTESPESFEDVREELLYDLGLDLQLLSKNKANMKMADVVINTGFHDEKWDYNFKNKAIYFDLGNNTEKIKQLLRKREDILVVDGFNIKMAQETVSVADFEPALFIKSREYRNILTKGYQYETCKAVIETVNSLDIKVHSFCRLGKAYY